MPEMHKCRVWRCRSIKVFFGSEMSFETTVVENTCGKMREKRRVRCSQDGGKCARFRWRWHGVGLSVQVEKEIGEDVRAHTESSPAEKRETDSAFGGQ